MEEITKTTAVQSGKVKQLTFLQTTDIHGQVLTHPEFFWENNRPVFRNAGGMSRIATLFKQVKKENPGNVLAVDCGDCFQGSAVAALSEGEALIPIMNKIGYDVAIPGNWEVVYGPQQLMNLTKKYNYPIICSNMYWGDEGVSSGPSLFPPFFIKVVGGVRVGFIGYNDPYTKLRQAPSYHEGIQFSKPEASIPKLVDILRNKHKCDIVMMLAHLGLAQQVHLAKQPQAAGIDFLFGGDTHERTYEPIYGGLCPVVEAGSFGSFVGRLDLFVESGKIKDYNYELKIVEESLYPEDPAVKVTVQKERDPFRPVIERKLGETKKYLYRYSVLETPMDNMITDAVKAAANVDIGISNGFRFCPPIAPGPITLEHLYSMLPTIANLKRGTVTGKQLWDWMEQELETVFSTDITKRVGGWVVRVSGMHVVMTINNPKGKRVQSITVNGEPIQMDKDYTVAACDREGEPLNIICRIKKVKNVEVLDIDNYKAVEIFLEKNPVIDYDIEGRVKATDADGMVLSQLPGTTYGFR
ncbi:bifunctional metallophosphatase/5'-nucleotidase [Ferviditalea candida]|uniref:Bifunctional metallophosphatase/5'-nucleotidase n=1 Tax=Ferviditalea candida TaxID=3108399 RepID=A0ABU5ZES3_9BACL|nr:bifunctional metallophosphatase/5'-nucleotidase [Paenibacillaceae bacterium T2]